MAIQSRVSKEKLAKLKNKINLFCSRTYLHANTTFLAYWDRFYLLLSHAGHFLQDKIIRVGGKVKKIKKTKTFALCSHAHQRRRQDRKRERNSAELLVNCEFSKF